MVLLRAKLNIHSILRRLTSTFLILTILLCGCGSASEDAGSIDKAVDDNYRNYYEIFVRSYYDSNGDGIGDLGGVTEKLDYIADLGCNGIWLMPICPSTTYHKYDVTDYCDIDNEYGTLEDFDELVSECHARDIRLITDLVINHTSSKHPWFLEATEYLKTLGPTDTVDASVCPYVDYYHFTKEDKGSGYAKVAGTDYYYECEFWDGMPDLNLESEAVRLEIENIAKFWIDKGVDGFRMDAALHFEESDTEFNTETLNWLYSYCKSLNPDFYMVSEVWADKSTIAEYYQGSETPSFFDFAFADAEGDLIKAGRGKESATKFVSRMIDNEQLYREAYADYIEAPFTTNHDMARSANGLQSNENDIKYTAGLLLSMTGSPYIYYGEEIGAKSKGTKDENKRLHMLWSNSDSEGITNDPENADQGIEQVFPSVEEQIIDSESILNYYKKALHIRNAYPEIARGASELYEGITSDNDDVAAISRSWNDNTIIIAYNTGDEALEADIKPNMEILDAMYISEETASIEDGKLLLPAKSIIYLREK